MKKIYDEKYSMMDKLYEASPQTPSTAYWLMQNYVEMERELPFPETADKQAWDVWKKNLRSRLRELMYIDTWGDITRVPEYEIWGEEKCNGYIKQKISFESVPGNYAIAYILIPEGIEGKVPGVICPCGHVGKYGSLCVIEPEKAQSTGYGVAYGYELTKQGCVTITIENAGYAERDIPEGNYDPNGHTVSCDLLFRRLNHIGRDLTGLRIYELTLCLNILCSLPMVDAGKIGVAGLSGGCWLSQVLSALDDRIRAVVLSGYFTTFAQTAWNGHCLCHHPHGIGKVCDMTDLSALIAPRPQFVESGAQDIYYPPEPAYSIVTRAYQYWDAEDSLQIHVYDGGHMFKGERSIPWLVETLKHL